MGRFVADFTAETHPDLTDLRGTLRRLVMLAGMSHITQ